MLNKANLLALHPVARGAMRDFPLPSGKRITLRGVTATEYVSHVVRRFDSVADNYLTPALAVAGLTDAERASVSRDGEVDSAAAMALLESKVDVEDLMRRSMLDAMLVDAAFLAISAGYPADADVEAAFMEWPDEDFLAAVKEAERLTYGGDSGPFFEDVQRKVLRLGDAPRTPATPSTNSSPRNTGTASQSTSRKRPKR